MKLSSTKASILKSLPQSALLIKWPPGLGHRAGTLLPPGALSLSLPANRRETGNLCNFLLLIVMPRSLLS